MNLQNKNNIDFSDVNFFDEGDPLADECGPSSAVASALPVIQVEEPGQVALVEEEVAPVAEVVELSTEESSEEAKGEENSSKKRKPPSVPLRFANHLLSQRNGGAWGGRVEEGGTLIHKWNGSHYAYISDSDGMTMANKWLTEHAPDQATKKPKSKRGSS